jgi:hypothetical protein
MYSNPHSRLLLWVATIACTIIFGCRNSSGAGADIRNDGKLSYPCWPPGVSNLVNTTNRIHGFVENCEVVLYFSGSTTNFNAFLQEYSEIQGLKAHRLILHDGSGVAKSPWAKAGRPCDWELYDSCSVRTNHVTEAHFWTGGHIALGQVTIPQNIEVRKDK